MRGPHPPSAVAGTACLPVADFGGIEQALAAFAIANRVASLVDQARIVVARAADPAGGNRLWSGVHVANITRNPARSPLRQSPYLAAQRSPPAARLAGRSRVAERAWRADFRGGQPTFADRIVIAQNHLGLGAAMEWLILVGVAVLTAWYFSSRRKAPGASVLPNRPSPSSGEVAPAPPADTGLRIVKRPDAPPPPPTESIASIAKRARKYRDIRFVGDVLKHYRKTGSMSPKQAAALYRIIVEREAEDAAIARDE